MRKNKKKITACALVAMLSLTCAAYPVNAEDTLLAQQKETEHQSEIEEPVVPTEETTDSESESESPEFTSELDTSEDTEEFTDETEPAEKTVPTSDPVPQSEKQDENVMQSYASNNAGDFNVTGGTSGTHWGYNQNENTLKFYKGGTYTITGNGVETNQNIYLSPDNTYNITIENVNIKVDGIVAFNVDINSTLNLTLVGTNNLVGTGYYGGALVLGNLTDKSGFVSLTIQGSGSLQAKSGDAYAGIGTQVYADGDITINSGTIDASSISQGAGIGGGRAASVNKITINGGNIRASSNNGGAGIGSGNRGTVKEIIFNGGTVTAIIDPNSIQLGTFSIGSGAGSSAEKVLIKNGSISATWNRISPSPIDENNNQLYLCQLPELNGVNEVMVDERIYTRSGDHPNGNGTFYLYLTGQDHTISADGKTYQVYWDNATQKFKFSNPNTPTVTIDKTTANSITVNELTETDKYGAAEYSMDSQNWQDSNVFENLSANTEYTVFARYKGNDTYAESEAGTIRASTSPATYVVSIPMTAVADNSENKIGVDGSKGFDLGYNGKVNVKIKDTDTMKNGVLSLTREHGNNETITSQLLVGGSPFTDLLMNVATFKNKDDEDVSFAFQKPANKNILAGTYKGTVVFDISYSED